MKLGLERKVGKILASGTLLFSLGCNITGSDVMGVGLRTVSPYVRNPVASSVTRGAGDLALTNAQRGHEIKRERAGATNLNISQNIPTNNSQLSQNLKKKSDYNPLNDSDLIANISPDGENLVFARNLGYNTEIFVSDIYGKDLKRLTFTSDRLEYNPCWSPDGKKIVFLSVDKGGNGGIHLMNANGSENKMVKEVEDVSMILYGRRINFFKKYNQSFLTSSHFEIKWEGDSKIECTYTKSNKISADLSK